MLRFSEMEPAKENIETLPEKVVRNEPPFSLTERLLNMHGIVSSKTTLVL